MSLLARSSASEIKQHKQAFPQRSHPVKPTRQLETNQSLMTQPRRGNRPPGRTARDRCLSITAKRVNVRLIGRDDLGCASAYLPVQPRPISICGPVQPGRLIRQAPHHFSRPPIPKAIDKTFRPRGGSVPRASDARKRRKNNRAPAGDDRWGPGAVCPPPADPSLVINGSSIRFHASLRAPRPWGRDTDEPRRSAGLIGNCDRIE